MKILVAEDDPLIGAGVAHGLRQSGFSVDWVKDGKEAELALLVGAYALVVLDIGLPRQDGLQLLKKLRATENPIAVLILTARDGIQDRVAGLNSGADDYLVKPFDLEELIARVYALIRRMQGRANSELRLGSLRVEPSTRAVTLQGKELTLSAREFMLLVTLLEKPGTVLSVRQLEDKLYGWGEEVASNTIEVHLHRLRAKLGKEWIRNVRGVGYKIVDPN